MKRTIKKYKKWPLSRKHKKTIKLRHKKYTGGTKTKTPKRKPLFKIVEQFDHELASAVDSAAQKTQDILQNASLAAPNELLSILPFEKPVLPIEKPVLPIEKTVLPFEKTVLPIEKPVLPIENSLGMDLKTFKEEKHKMPGRLNETFIDLMEQLSNIMMKQGEPFKARAYQKAQETIMSYHGDITSPEQLKGLPAIGSTIMEKLNEYMQTGTLRILEREKSNPVNILGEIYGIGPKKAKELVDGGITTIAQLREEQDSVLNATQKIGLKYYEDIMKRIPRAEIDHYNTIFKDIFSSVVSASASDSESRFEIVGSYRRGAQSSGDIDMIITSKTGAIFKKFIDELIKNGIILEVLSRGDKKCLVIAKLPGAEVARRVDFLYTSPEEYPFSVLYFTGSKIFNTVMRGRALSLGYSLNEHEMTKMGEKVKGEKAVKGAKVAHVFTSEKDIFDFLGMVYREPSERIDGRSVILTANVGQIEVAPLPVSISEKVKEEKEEKKEKKKGKIATLKNVKKMIGEEGVKTLKPKTLKKNKEVIMGDAIMGDAIELINNFKKNGIQVLESLTEPQLSSMVAEANKAFHFDKTPLMTDNEFDIMKEFLEKKFPDSEALKEVGTPIIEKNKVTLPYEMASMDKIKPDTGSLVSWKQKYAGPYVISCKLDGVSGMYSTEGGVPKLYTRGNGKVGQDISHFIPFLRLPPASSGSIVVRGEFVIPKKVFHDKYSSTFANPRNFVAGIVNRQTIDESVVRDLHFVAYEVIVPQLKPSAQMQMLVDHGFEAVMNRGIMTAGDLTNELLSETLIKWRAEYLYEIDGVIVTDDKIYNRAAGNPEHSFAFKMVLSDQIAEAKVVDVIWTPSKDGYLKPRVQIEPIQLGGVKIEYATGFNAAFIEQNKIGVGALIQIIRSGDVIPHIRGVTVPAVEAKMPSVPYVWNETHVDIMLEDAGADSTVREKNIAGFFKGIGVDGLSSGNVARIIAAGYDSVPAIIHMTKADFEKAGFKTLAQKFVDGIRDKLAAASLIVLMSASNIFGRGFSEKRVELILEAYPDILVSPESAGEKVQKIAGVKGMATKTAEAFVEKIPEFVKFIGECGLQDKLVLTVSVTAVETSHPLYKKTVVMTGVRDPGVSAALKSVGANLGTAVSKNTVAVIANNPEGEETGKALTGKALDAKKLGIPIMTPAEFMSAYFS